MSEGKKLGFIEGNKFIFAAFFAVVTTILQYFFIEEMSIGRIIFSVTFLFVIMLSLNWLVIKWEIWLDKKLAERKLWKKN